MKWPYDLIDWEWEMMENGGTVLDAVEYALKKKVTPLCGIILVPIGLEKVLPDLFTD